MKKREINEIYFKSLWNQLGGRELPIKITSTVLSTASQNAQRESKREKIIMNKDLTYKWDPWLRKNHSKMFNTRINGTWVIQDIEFEHLKEFPTPTKTISLKMINTGLGNFISSYIYNIVS